MIDLTSTPSSPFSSELSYEDSSPPEEPSYEEVQSHEELNYEGTQPPEEPSLKGAQSSEGFFYTDAPLSEDSFCENGQLLEEPYFDFPTPDELFTDTWVLKYTNQISKDYLESDDPTLFQTRQVDPSQQNWKYEKRDYIREFRNATPISKRFIFKKYPQLAHEPFLQFDEQDLKTKRSHQSLLQTGISKKLNSENHELTEDITILVSRSRFRNKGALERIRQKTSRKPFSELREQKDKLLEETLKRKVQVIQEHTSLIQVILPEDFHSKVNQNHVDSLGLSITSRDMTTLYPGQWLNDEVINSYLSLLALRSKSNPGKYPKIHVFNTFFYTTIRDQNYNKVKRWTRKVDIFNQDLIIIPVHLGMHWCCSCIDFRTKTIEYYDPLFGPNTQIFDLIHDYLNKESMDKRKQPFDFTEWKTLTPSSIPNQQNGYDCGVFLLQFADYLSRPPGTNPKFPFSQEDMNYFRQRVMYEIASGRLLES